MHHCHSRQLRPKTIGRCGRHCSNGETALANISGVTPSSVYSMLDPRRKEVSVNLVKKLCDGLDMSLGEFFSEPVFDELEQEIQ